MSCVHNKAGSMWTSFLSTLILVSQWQQILVAMFPDNMESLPRGAEAVLMTL